MFKENLKTFLTNIHPSAEHAFQYSQDVDFPNRKMEDWKYTSLKKMTEERFQKKSSSELFETHSDGVIALEPLNIWKHSFKDFFEAYNKATLNRVCHYVVKKTQKTESIDIQYVIKNLEYMSAFIRIDLEEGAQLQFLENLEIDGFLNVHLEIHVLKGAHCELLRTVRSDELSSYAVHTSDFNICESASMRCVQIGTGLTTFRQNIVCNLNEPSAQAELLGFNSLLAARSVDNNIHSNHHVGMTLSRQSFKTILTEKSKSVFQGRIFIEKNAQKSDAEQLNKNLILSQDCEVDTKPQLDVYADDVKANHGAAIGQLNMDELFYLQSRGLSLSQATDLLTSGYGLDIINKLTSSKLHKEALVFLDNSLTRKI